MGQKTNPISNRLGVIRGWDSNWYGGKDYAAKILEDTKSVSILTLVWLKLAFQKSLLREL